MNNIDYEIAKKVMGFIYAQELDVTDTTKIYFCIAKKEDEDKNSAQLLVYLPDGLLRYFHPSYNLVDAFKVVACMRDLGFMLDMVAFSGGYKVNFINRNIKSLMDSKNAVDYAAMYPYKNPTTTTYFDVSAPMAIAKGVLLAITQFGIDSPL